MLRAGLAKLKKLEASFTDFTKDSEGYSSKHPKMLVICEDTSVSPLVVDFLTHSENLSSDDVMQIDSDKKGSIPAKEWAQVKQRLFNLAHRGSTADARDTRPFTGDARPEFVSPALSLIMMHMMRVSISAVFRSRFPR
jgi:hypothetical protein